MSTTLTDRIYTALAEFSSASRLYELKVGEREQTGLVVEAFFADDGVQQVGTRDVIALSTDACLALDSLLGQPAVLEISLADGTRERFAGEICEAAMLGSDGGLARYRIRLSSWLWRLAEVRNSRVWQDKTIVEIVDAVFKAYQPLARWRWSGEVGAFLDEVSPRSYCCQYRESDLAFVQRILAEEGLCWRHEQTEAGPGLVLFADSSQRSAVVEDTSSEALGGIRFHGARSVEESDSIQALSAERRLHASLTTVLSYDYKAKQVVAASSPSHYTYGKLPELESFEVPGQYAFANWQQAQHYADLRMEAQEARAQMWRGRSTVRTLRAGTRVEVLGAPLQRLNASASLTVLRVCSIGVNNMPPLATHALAELFGPIPELLDDLVREEMPDELELAIAQAQGTGYANWFSAVSSKLIWRPQLPGSEARAYPKPVAFGAQSAIVVGADGNDQPSGPNELYCDRLGRVRIRFHWQESGDATCWVRVAQRSAGGGMGQQFLPRIGQEVLVQFLENDIDRPIVVGALYNGRGAGGVVATPGGRRDSETDLSCFKAAHDHASSAQGNLSGGNSPVWHGGSTDIAGHRNPTSQWGIRSKEFGSDGYSELLLDDADGQGRVQLKSTYSGSAFLLGHLVHVADNYRGGLRGAGAELRTDAYGVARAGNGMLVSSYKLNQNSVRRDACGENSSGASLMKQAASIAEIYSAAAGTHQSVTLASYLGTTKKDKSESTAAPIGGLLISLSGMVSAEELKKARADAIAKKTAVEDNKIPNLSDPIISISARHDFGANAGQNFQMASNDAVLLICGEQKQFVVGMQTRIQSKQTIGFLASAVAPDDENVGLKMITAKDHLEIQSQADEIQVNAKNETTIVSAEAQVELAASRKISFTTAGGATIIIEDGNIMFQCPGKITIMAGKKTFQNPAKISYAFPALPRSELEKKKKYAFSS